MSTSRGRGVYTHHNQRDESTLYRTTVVMAEGSQNLRGYVSKRKRKPRELSGGLAGDLTGDLTGDRKETTTPCSHLSQYVVRKSDNQDLKKTRFQSTLPKLSTELPTGHSKPVLSLEWHPVDHRLLVSAGLDGKVVLWDVKKKQVVTSCSFHGGSAVRDVEWATEESVLTAGYDCFAIQSDIGYEKELVRLKHDSYVSVVKSNPASVEAVLTGDSHGNLQMWDLRSGKVTKSYKGAGGKILDAAFLLQSQGAFVASSDIVRKNAFSQAINVWDIASGVTLTHQLYFEPFTCPCLKVHGDRGDILSQSNGNYVVIFAPERPFRLNKHKRFEGHSVSGFDVAFDMSPDGSVLCSASSEGNVHFYNYLSSRTAKILTVSGAACLGVSWSKRLPSSQVAISDWNGAIHILD